MIAAGFWGGFLVGLLIGAPIGFFMAALAVAAARADREEEG